MKQASQPQFQRKKKWNRIQLSFADNYPKIWPIQEKWQKSHNLDFLFNENSNCKFSNFFSLRKTVHTIFPPCSHCFLDFFLPFVLTQMAYQTDSKDSNSDYENLGDILIGDLNKKFATNRTWNTEWSFFTGWFPTYTWLMLSCIQPCFLFLLFFYFSSYRTFFKTTAY